MATLSPIGAANSFCPYGALVRTSVSHAAPLTFGQLTWKCLTCRALIYRVHMTVTERQHVERQGIPFRLIRASHNGVILPYVRVVSPRLIGKKDAVRVLMRERIQPHSLTLARSYSHTES
jgi:hypothetical protein